MLFVVEEVWAGSKQSVFCDKRLSVAMQYVTLHPEMQFVRVYKETKNNKVQVWPNPNTEKQYDTDESFENEFSSYLRGKVEAASANGAVEEI